MANLKGIFPAIITPMTREGTLNEAAFREVIEFNIQSGVHGFWIAGGTGESVLLDDEENMRIAEIAADQSRGRINNIMHVGAATTKRAAALAENAARAGVESICCVPPFFYRQTDQAIVEHYRAVAAAADLPLLVYNLPHSTGVEITPEMMKRIQDGVPQLVGLKHSAVTFPNVRAFAKMGLSCLIGNSTLMLPALTIGATRMRRRASQRRSRDVGRHLERLQRRRSGGRRGGPGQGQRRLGPGQGVRLSRHRQGDPQREAGGRLRRAPSSDASP